MPVAILTIPLDVDTARIYTTASTEDQKKMRLLFSLWLRELDKPQTSLPKLMDELSEKAQARGLTAEIVESILNAR